jgi:hypothetical protein
MIVITQKQMQVILWCSLVDLFLRGFDELKTIQDGGLYVLFHHLEASPIYMSAKSLSSAGILSQSGNLLEPSTKNRKGLKETFTKLVLNLWHHHWIGVDEGKMKTCRSNLIFLPSLSKSRDEIPVKWG